MGFKSASFEQGSNTPIACESTGLTNPDDQMWVTSGQSAGVNIKNLKCTIIIK